MTIFSQSNYRVRLEWGAAGVAALAPISDICIIVDVLSFSTCVDIAVGRGASIYPTSSAIDLPNIEGALLAGGDHGLRLSPASLTSIGAGTRLILPSLNGSVLSHAAAGFDTTVLSGCLRNASAVAAWACLHGESVAVIAAGERWPDGSLRPAVEDLVGAGAIVSGLSGTRSPEAELAVGVFETCRDQLQAWLADCVSGREKFHRGEAEDVTLAGALDISTAVPILDSGGYGSAAIQFP